MVGEKPAAVCAPNTERSLDSVILTTTIGERVLVDDKETDAFSTIPFYPQALHCKLSIMLSKGEPKAPPL